ncbi:MAG: (Fe-S)-binding protein [Methanocellales archaeon]
MLLEEKIRDILKCTRCGKCVATCPAYEELGWESTSARGRMLLSKALIEKTPITQRLYDGLYTCTTCGYCSAICPSGAQPDHVVEIARRSIVLQGVIADRIKIMSESVEKFGNPLREAKPRYAWLLKEEIELKKKSDLVYFAGCLTSYRSQEVARATFKILNKFNAALLPDERCCGSPLIRLGEMPSKAMEVNMKQIKEIGAKTIVTSCAGCYKTLKKDYNLDIEILHSSEFIANHLQELNLSKLNLRVTYHDPCHLGRHNKVYDAPRKVIKQICELVEMKNIKDKAQCCGGGGGVRSGYPNLSLAIAKKRIEDVPNKIDYVVSTCPLCERNLSDVGLKVLDLTQLVEMAMGISA